ncbi:hypothetical protein V5O48_005840, partial [Marasmius crinis-equi]
HEAPWPDMLFRLPAPYNYASLVFAGATLLGWATTGHKKRYQDTRNPGLMKVRRYGLAQDDSVLSSHPAVLI